MVSTEAREETTERRERRRHARREAILDAAQTLFNQRGVEATTMDDIARACDVAKGTLYLSFPSKDEIAFALVTRALEELHSRVGAAVEGGGTAVEGIQRMADAYYAFSQERPESFNYLFLVPHPDYIGRVADDVAEGAALVGFESLELLAGLVRQGTKEGTLSVIDPWATAVGMWSALTGVIVIPTRDTAGSLIGIDHGQLVRDMVRALLNGLHPDFA